jgi:putative nucleotidyltransferase with HDIG domain
MAPFTISPEPLEAWLPQGWSERGGYSGIVLDRLAKHAVHILDADESCILVRDQTHPDTSIVAAARGGAETLIGKRVPSAAGRAWAHGGAVAELCWHGDVQGELSVSRSARTDGFSDGDAALLRHLADMGGAAVCHAQARGTAQPGAGAAIAALVASLDERDGYTARHSQEVVAGAGAVGRAVGMDGAEVAELEVAALLHDIGKVHVPDSILNKRSALTATEHGVMAQHPAWGAEMLTQVPGLEVVAAIVRFHHERWDGAGYPDSLSGTRIPLASRIIAVCDSHNAMTSDRPYRRAMSDADARTELHTGAGWQFDPGVVAAFDSSFELEEHS